MKKRLLFLIAIFVGHLLGISESTKALSITLNTVQIPNDSVELTIPPENGEALLYLYKGETLEELVHSPKAILITNAPVIRPLKISLAPEPKAFFYAIRRTDVSIDDIHSVDYPEEDVSGPFFLWTMGLPEELVVGSHEFVDFLLMASMKQLASFSGPGSLVIISKSTGERHPNATTAPEIIYFASGHSRTKLEINALTSLEGYTLALDLSQQTEKLSLFTVGLQSNNSRLQPSNQFVNPANDPSQPLRSAEEQLRNLQDSPGWHNPLETANPEVSGTFGEWRGHIRRGVPHSNFHAGLDLVASAGSVVMAARGGRVVSTASSSDGSSVIIDHYDGTFTAYYHLSRNGLARISTRQNDRINRGTRIGVIAGTNELKHVLPHLHFEIYTNGVSGSTGTYKLGKKVDPLGHPDMEFSVRTPESNVRLYLVGVMRADLTSDRYFYQTPTTPPPVNQNPVYVLAQVKHQEKKVGVDGTRNLPPRFLRFSPEGIDNWFDLSTPNEQTISELLPSAATKSSTHGFARYKHGDSSTPEPKDWFRYWFKWDVSGYEDSLKGPRSFTFEAATYDRTATPSKWVSKWGPEITEIRRVGSRENNKQKYQVDVDAWLGQSSSPITAESNRESSSLGADWYSWELPEGGVWVSNGSNILHEVSSSLGNNLKRSNQFIWDLSKNPQPVRKVIVRSRTVPAIAHQLLFGVSSNPDDDEQEEEPEDEEPPDSPPGMRIRVTGGPFSPAEYSVAFSGGNSGTFEFFDGGSGSGRYVYNGGTLTFIYGGVYAGEEDVLDLTFNTATSGSFTGTIKIGDITFTNFKGTFSGFPLR